MTLRQPLSKQNRKTVFEDLDGPDMATDHRIARLSARRKGTSGTPADLVQAARATMTLSVPQCSCKGDKPDLSFSAGLC